MANERKLKPMPDVSFKGMTLLYKVYGLIFISHVRIKMSRTREIVENTGLFTMVECRGHDMLVAPKAKQ